MRLPGRCSLLGGQATIRSPLMRQTPFVHLGAARPVPESGGQRRDILSRLLPWVLLSLACVRAINLASVQLPFNGWDELAHIAAAYHTREYGHMPLPISPMPLELGPFAKAHPHPTDSLGMLRGIDAKPYPGAAEPPRRVRMRLYEAQHGPLFYHLAPVLLPDSTPLGLLTWVDRVRAANIALLLCTLLLWRRILRRAVAGMEALSWLPDGVMLLMVSFSYVFYNFVRFANDALALFLGTLVLELYAAWLKGRDHASPAEAWRYGILGALAGAAVLAKATCMVLLPVVAGCLAWRWLRLGAGRRAATGVFLACLAAFLLGYAVVAGPYHARMLASYGQITGMQEGVLNHAMGFSFTDLIHAAGKTGYTFFRNPVFYNGLLHQAGWSNLVSPRWINQGYRNWLTLCALLLLAALARKNGRELAGRVLSGSPELPLLLAAGVMALLFHAAQSTLCWGVPTTGPWYGMIFLPVLFFMLLAGPALLGRTTAATFVLFLAFLGNCAFLDGTYGALLTQETGTQDFFAALNIAGGHHALFHFDHYTLFVVELGLLCTCMTLTMREMLGLAQGTRQTVVFITTPPVAEDAEMPAAIPPGGVLERGGLAEPSPMEK